MKLWEWKCVMGGKDNDLRSEYVYEDWCALVIHTIHNIHVLLWAESMFYFFLGFTFSKDKLKMES